MDKSPFRKIPAEIRCMIWNLAFDFCGLKEHNLIELDCSDASKGVAILGPKMAVTLAISRTCKEIRKESYHTLFFKATIDVFIGCINPYSEPSVSCHKLQRQLIASALCTKLWLQTVPFGDEIGQLKLSTSPVDLDGLPTFPVLPTLHDLFPTRETKVLLPKLSRPVVYALEILFEGLPTPLLRCDHHYAMLDDDEPEWSPYDSLPATVSEIPIGNRDTSRKAVEEHIRQMSAMINEEMSLRRSTCSQRDPCSSWLGGNAAQEVIESLFGKPEIE